MVKNSLFIPQHQLKLLDWEQILSELKSGLHFESNQYTLELEPFLDFSTIEHSIAILGQFMLELDHLSSLFARRAGHLSSGQEFFNRTLALKKGAILDAKELNFVAMIIELYLDFRRLIPANLLGIELEQAPLLSKSFLRPIRQFLDEFGTIHFDKHPELSEIQKKIQQLDQRLRERIQAILREEPYLSSAQFNQYDIINERYVLPIRSDSYQHQLGAIIAKSNTGMTLFVEPVELRDLSNLRMQNMAQRDDILNKIYIQYSSILEKHFQEITSLLSYSLSLDNYLAKAVFCDRKKLIPPEISQDQGCDVVGYFHPLLANPVTNDLTLTHAEYGIIISGPNTGGKTVTLKSLALCHLFLHMGLFVPASYAKLPLIKSLYYFSHDQQDLSQGLSSFSSEAKNYLELLNTINDDSYVFIDEIFNSTSSEEASALAIGLLNELHQLAQVKVFLSTHHQLLKTFMHSNEKYISCHVGYDFQQDTPTYKIIKGTPGSSLALSIFKKLSTDTIGHQRIFEKASSIMETKQVSYESLLEDLTQKKTELDKTLLSSKQLQLELQNQKKASEGILFLEREKLKSEYKKQLEQLLSKAESWFKEVKSSPEMTRKSFYKEHDHLKFQIKGQLQEQRPSTPPSQDKQTPVEIELIRVNERFFCEPLKSEVEILALNPKKKKAQVRKGALSLWVDYSQLYHSKHRPKPQQISVSVHVQKDTQGKLEIDCRGMRLDEFERAVFYHLEELLCGDIPYLSVVHGHGDGILKNWLRQHLKSRVDDFEWNSPDGNDGSTIIRLAT